MIISLYTATLVYLSYIFFYRNTVLVWLLCVTVPITALLVTILPWQLSKCQSCQFFFSFAAKYANNKPWLEMGCGLSYKQEQ